MKRPVWSARFRSVPIPKLPSTSGRGHVPALPSPSGRWVGGEGSGPPKGYTLVEILVATALTLVLVAAVVQIFGSIGESVNNSRATLEMSDRVRSARTRLEMDLASVTASMLPPLRPETAQGYFEYIEGPIGPVFPPSQVAINTDDSGASVADTTVGDMDDRLLLTIRSSGRPFVGRCVVTGGTIESDVAEVAWFLRGTTLYRRVMLVVPGIELPNVPLAGFFANNDLSVRPVFDANGKPNGLVANSLGDLTKRECRYAHRLRGAIGFPFDARTWGQLGLPTLRECSSPRWFTWNNVTDLPSVSAAAQIDFWNDAHPWANVDKVTGTLAGYDGPRVAEDLVLTNVIGFDVKVWDPGAPVRSDGTAALGPSDPGYDAFVNSGAPVVSFGAYVDLGYENVPHNPAAVFPPGVPAKRFNHVGCVASGLAATSAQPARVYDTWSFHYEHDGIDQDGRVGPDQGTNGFDDDLPGQPGYGLVDDTGELETSPPYPVPLQAIQIKIRVYEPDSRQIREVTVVQDFLPK